MAHVILRAPRLRNEHHHRMRRVAPGGDEKLEHVVQRGGVGLPLTYQRQNLLKVNPVGGDHRTPRIRPLERRLARGKRIQVSLYRIDLAVVRDASERMRKLPRRECIRGIPLVDYRKRRNEIRIGEVWVELLDLRCEKKPLVDDRPRRARADIGASRRLFNLAANGIKAKLEGGAGRETRGARRECAARLSV